MGLGLLGRILHLAGAETDGRSVLFSEVRLIARLQACLALDPFLVAAALRLDTLGGLRLGLRLGAPDPGISHRGGP